LDHQLLPELASFWTAEPGEKGADYQEKETAIAWVLVLELASLEKT
jgi:hypothetical protein